MTSASKTKVIKDGFSSEQVNENLLYTKIQSYLIIYGNFLQATSNSSGSKRLQAGEIDYKEAVAASAVSKKIEKDGIKAEQNAAVLKVTENPFSILIKVTVALREFQLAVDSCSYS